MCPDASANTEQNASCVGSTFSSREYHKWRFSIPDHKHRNCHYVAESLCYREQNRHLFWGSWWPVSTKKFAVIVREELFHKKERKKHCISNFQLYDVGWQKIKRIVHNYLQKMKRNIKIKLICAPLINWIKGGNVKGHKVIGVTRP